MKRVKNEEFQNEVERDYASRFIAEQYVSRGYYLHYHRNIEIYGVVKGNVNVMISGKSMSLSDGQMAVIDGLENHCYEIDGEAEIFYVNIGMRYIRDFTLMYPDKRLPHWLIDVEYNKVIYERIKQFLGQVTDAIPELTRVGITCEMFADIIEHYGVREKNISTESDNKLMNRIVQYIYDHYNENITLEALSEIFFLSPKTLSKKISKRLNVDLRVFVNDIRAQKVIQMLDDPANKDKTLDDIIVLCGFNNMRTFYRSYKRNFKFHKLEKQ